MQITVNDKVTEVVEGLSLKQLIEDLSVDENGLALAVNQQVINRTLWPQHALHADGRMTARQQHVLHAGRRGAACFTCQP